MPTPYEPKRSCPVNVISPDELLMPMARDAAADDLAFEHAERGEQSGRAVAFVIVREGCAFSPASAEDPAGFGRAPGSGFSRRSRPPPHGGAGSCRDRRHHQA